MQALLHIWRPLSPQWFTNLLRQIWDLSVACCYSCFPTHAPGFPSYEAQGEGKSNSIQKSDLNRARISLEWAARLKAQAAKESKKTHVKQPGHQGEFQSSSGSFTSLHEWRCGLLYIGVEPAATYLPSVSQCFNSLLMGSTFQTNPIDGEHTVTYKWLTDNLRKSRQNIICKTYWCTETFKSQLTRTVVEGNSPSPPHAESRRELCN